MGLVHKIQKKNRFTWFIPEGLKGFYYRNLISDQGVLMFAIKHGALPELRGNVLRFSDTSPGGYDRHLHGRYSPRKLKRHLFEVNLPSSSTKPTKNELKKKKVGEREKTIWHTLRTPGHIPVSNRVDIFDSKGAILSSNGITQTTARGVDIGVIKGNITSAIKDISATLQTPQGIPSTSTLLTGDMTIDFGFVGMAEITMAGESILRHLLLTEFKKLFSLEEPLHLHISTSIDNDFVGAMKPPIPQNAAYFDQQRQEFALRVIGYTLTQWNPITQVCQFKINFQGDNLNASRTMNRKARLSRSESSNFFAEVMKQLQLNSSLWRYTIESSEDAEEAAPGEFDVDSTHNLPLTLSATRWADVQIDLENQLKLQAGDKDAIREYTIVTKRDAKGIPTETKTVKTTQKLKTAKHADRTEDGFFTTIGSLLVAILAVYTEGLTDYSSRTDPGDDKSPFRTSGTDFMPLAEMRDLFIGIQRTFPISLFKNYGALDEALDRANEADREAKLHGQGGRTAESGMAFINAMQNVMRFKQEGMTKDDMCSVLDVPITGRIMRQFFTEVFEHGRANNFSSMLKAVLDGLVTRAVKQSFFKASDEYGWFNDIYGIDQNLLGMGSLIPYSSISEGIFDELHGQGFAGASGLMFKEALMDRLFGVPDYEGGISVLYYSLANHTGAEISRALKAFTKTATTTQLLKLKVLPLQFGAFKPDLLEESLNLRIAQDAKSNNSPIKFSVVDSKEAEESRRQDALAAGLKTIIRRFYKITFTVWDVINFLPFVHRIYLPPAAFGFDSAQEDEFGLSGVYVITNVSYSIKNMDRIDVNLTAQWDHIEFQYLVDAKGLARFVEANAADEAEKKRATAAKKKLKEDEEKAKIEQAKKSADRIEEHKSKMQFGPKF